MQSTTDNAQEWMVDKLDSVTGGYSEPYTSGSSANADGITAYCKTCGSKLVYMGQQRVEGGNTSVFKCTNNNYKGKGKKCPEYGQQKYNGEVDFQKKK